MTEDDGTSQEESNLPVTPSDGGLYTTTQDLLKWSHVISGKMPSVLSAQIIRKIQTPYISVSSSQMQDKISYGYGLFINDFAGGTLIHHPGHIVGFKSHVSLFSEKDIFVAILCNNVASNPMKITETIFKILLDIY